MSRKLSRGTSRFVVFPNAVPQDRLYATYFPEEINLTWATKWAEMTIPGRRTKAYQYLGGGEKPFNFKLLFDAVEKRSWDSSTPAEAIAWFDKNVPPNMPSADPDTAFDPTHNGVFTVALFGDSERSSYRILIKSVKGKIEHYLQDAPARLEVEVEAVEYEPLIYTSKWKRSDALKSMALVRVHDDVTGFTNYLTADQVQVISRESKLLTGQSAVNELRDTVDASAAGRRIGRALRAAGREVR